MGKIAVNDSKIMDALSECVLMIDPHTGDVFRRIAGKLKRPKLQIDYRGYKRFMLSHHGKRFTILVHRLVWMSVHGKPSSSLMQINHIDGNKGNNNIVNLEMVTGSRNQRHAGEIGLRKIGLKSLSTQQISDIKLRYKYRSITDGINAMQKDYVVSKTAIWRAIYGCDTTKRFKGREYQESVGRRRDMRSYGVAEFLKEKEVKDG